MMDTRSACSKNRGQIPVSPDIRENQDLTLVVVPGQKRAPSAGPDGGLVSQVFIHMYDSVPTVINFPNNVYTSIM